MPEAQKPEQLSAILQMIKAGRPATSMEEVDDFMARTERGASVSQALSNIRSVSPRPTSMPQTNVPDPQNLPEGVTANEFQAQPAWRTDEEYVEANQRPGVELDPTSGGPVWARIAAKAMQDKGLQHKFFSKKLGPDNVRLDDEGDWLLGFVQPDGSKKEIKLDERKMSGKDLLDVAVEFPELIMSTIAMMKGGKGIWGQSAAGALGYSGTGAIRDVLGALSQNEGPDFPEIGKRRGIEAAIDTVAGKVLGEGANFLFTKTPKLVGLVPEPSERAVMGRQGTEAIKEKLGIELPQSGSEVTGSSSLAALEGILDKLPIIRGWRDKQRAFKRSQELKVAEALLGPEGAVPVGEDLRGAVMSKASAAEGAVDAARAASTQGAEAEIGQIFKGSAPTGQKAFELGSLYADSAQGMLAQAKTANKLNFDAVYELDEAGKDLIPMKPIAAKAQELLDNLPSVPAEGGGRELMKEWVQASGVERLTQAAARADQKTRLFDLVQMRDQLSDLIQNKASPIGDISTRNLKSLRSSITQAIDEGVEGLADGELKRRLKFANSEYKDFIQRFDDPDVEGLITPRREGGFDPEHWVAGLYAGGKGNTTRYKALKDFFGPDSPEIVQTKQYFLENILGASRENVTEKISPGSLIESVDGLANEFAKDLFGDRVQDVKVLARELAAADPNGKMNFEEFLRMAGEGNVSSHRIRQLQEAEKVRDQTYRNGIVEAYRKGSPIEIEPGEFASRMTSGNHSLAEIKEVMDLVNAADPATAEAVRRNYLLKFFKEASDKKVGPEEFGAFMKGKSMENLSPKDFVAHMGKPEVRKVMDVILTPGQVEILHDFGKYMMMAADTDIAKSGAGAIAGPMTVYSLMMGSMRALHKVLQYTVIGSLATSNKFGKVLMRLKSAPEDALRLDPRLADAILGAHIRSPEFARFLFESGASDEEINSMLDELQAAGFEVDVQAPEQ